MWSARTSGHCAHCRSRVRRRSAFQHRIAFKKYKFFIMSWWYGTFIIFYVAWRAVSPKWPRPDHARTEQASWLQCECACDWIMQGSWELDRWLHGYCCCLLGVAKFCGGFLVDIILFHIIKVVVINRTGESIVNLYFAVGIVESKR